MIADQNIFTGIGMSLLRESVKREIIRTINQITTIIKKAFTIIDRR